MSDLLMIFAKAPEPGQVKTRLTPVLSENEAADLQKAFILDLLDQTKIPCETHGIQRVMACSPVDHPFFKSLQKQEEVNLISQTGADLGERMKNAFRFGLDQGYKKIVIIGCDAPTLPVQFIENAFLSLSNQDLVIGPSLDGGYYLIGARALFSELFRDLPWGTDTVFSKTLDKINPDHTKIKLLPFWYDIDRPNDLHLLKNHLRFLKKQKPNLAKTTSERLSQYLSDRD